MVLNTRLLFCRLLRTFEIETVCDVGSLDGRDALKFRSTLPSATIFALEPNPLNFNLMEADETLRRNEIHVLPVAASDHQGTSLLYIVDANYSDANSCARRGMSSLYKRMGEFEPKQKVEVTTVRLDQLLADEPKGGKSIALWIDTEGKAFETIRGASGVLRSTKMLHVEVETREIIGAEQKIYSNVEELMREEGFELLATDQSMEFLQFNALYIRSELILTKKNAILWHVLCARLYRLMRIIIIRLMPKNLRLILGLHLTETRLR